MKVLIIGGAGYIGSHVARLFADSGLAVDVVDNLSTGSKDNLFPEYGFFQGDILDYPWLEGQMKRGGYEAVVHLAAAKAAGESMIVPQKYATQNIAGTINILNAACEAGIETLIFSSSAAVYGEPAYLPVDEEHPKEPENFYGFTKLEIDRFLAWYEKLKGLRFAALRYFNAAGATGIGRISAGVGAAGGGTGSAGSRVAWVKVGGQPIEPKKVYKLATNDFMLNGGDGYRSFVGAKALLGERDGKLLAKFVTGDEVRSLVAVPDGAGDTVFAGSFNGFVYRFTPAGKLLSFTAIPGNVTKLLPLADGAVENLRLPLIATVARGGVTLNPMCTPLAFDRLAAGGLVLRPARN